MALSFKLVLKMRKLPNDEAIHFKQDGQRFLQPNTVKLSSNANYRLTLVLRPRQDIQ